MSENNLYHPSEKAKKFHLLMKSIFLKNMIIQ